MTLRGTDGMKQKLPEALKSQNMKDQFLSSITPQASQKEAEDAIGFFDDSPAKKMKVSCPKSPPVDGADGFDTAWSDAVRDINLLFTKYSEVLRERAAVDAAQVQELTDILTEAMSLESQLKEKKEHLRQALAIISDKLQG